MKNLKKTQGFEHFSFKMAEKVDDSCRAESQQSPLRMMVITFRTRSNVVSAPHLTRPMSLQTPEECDSKLQTSGIFLQEDVKEDAVAEGEHEVVKMSEEWGTSTTEKCCKCKSGKVGWSASGRCSFCKGYVSKTTNVPSECKKVT